MSKIYEFAAAKPWLDRQTTFHGAPVGMLGDHESRLFYHLTQQVYEGHGTIIDAGSFLGKSAYFLAKGLRQNPIYNPAVHRVQCFDNFLVNEPNTVQFLKSNLEVTAAVGDSTRAIFDRQVKPVRDALDVFEGDFHTVEWPSQPIEILMVDIAKAESLGRRVAELFYTNLIPNVSIVIHQDYHHPWLPHVHVVMEHLADCFDLVVPQADDSAIFFYKKQAPPEALARAIAYDFSSEEKLDLMNRAIERLPREHRHFVALARVIMRLNDGPLDELRSELMELEGNAAELLGDRAPVFLQQALEVRTTVEEMQGWRCIANQDHAGALDLAIGVLRHRRNTHNLTMQGVAYIGLGLYHNAEKSLQAALQENPRSGFAYVELARVLYHRQQFLEAENLIFTAMADKSAGFAALSDYVDMLAMILNRQWNSNAEEAALRRLQATVGTGEPEVKILTAILAAVRKQPEKARQALEAARSQGADERRLTTVAESYHIAMR
jgi:tetratricopeptide (TPR) repeat protein